MFARPSGGPLFEDQYFAKNESWILPALSIITNGVGNHKQALAKIKSKMKKGDIRVNSGVTDAKTVYNNAQQLKDFLDFKYPELLANLRVYREIAKTRRHLESEERWLTEAAIEANYRAEHPHLTDK